MRLSRFKMVQNTTLSIFKRQLFPCLNSLLRQAAAAAGAIAPAPQQSYYEKSQKQVPKAKKARVEKSNYRSTEHILSTSNICERLLSLNKLIMTHLRKNMDPDTLTKVLFLKGNKPLRADKSIIDEIIADLAE